MIIYLASAIRPKGGQTLRGNIAKAKAVAIELWKKGYTVFCPAANTDLPSESAHALDLPPDVWLEFDFSILSICEAMVVAPGWEDSEGVNGEILFATERGIPVYYYPELPELQRKGKNG
jgi:hypothetical protein